MNSIRRYLDFFFRNHRTGVNNFRFCLFYVVMVVSAGVLVFLYNSTSFLDTISGNVMTIIMTFVPFLFSSIVVAITYTSTGKTTEKKEGIKHIGCAPIHHSVNRSESIMLLNQKIGDLWNDNRDLLFITGKSGIGKSWLLREFIDKDEDREQIVYIESYYSDFHQDERLTDDKFNLFIFDQFEFVLENDYHKELSDLWKIIEKEAKKGKERKRFIFCFKEEFLTEMSRLTDRCHFAREIYVIPTNETENRRMISLLRTGLNLSGEKSKDPAKEKRETFAEYVANCIERNQLSFIQLEMLNNIKNNTDRLKAFVDNHCKNPQKWDIHLMCQEYLREILNSTSDPFLAKMIVYLCSAAHKQGCYMCLYDFCNVTFESKSKVKGVLNELIAARIIVKHGEPGEELMPYEIRHDYFVQLIDKIMWQTFSSDIINNMENYVQKREIHEEMSGVYKRCYDKKDGCGEKRSLRPSSIVLTVITICIGLYMTYQINRRCVGGEPIDLFQLGMINLILFVSIFYVYNIYELYVRICGKKSSILLLGGIGAVGGSILWPYYWAMGMGIEVILLGLLFVFGMCRIAIDKEKPFFFTKGMIYIIVGIAMTVLGGCSVWFYRECSSLFWAMLPVIVIYIVFASVSIKYHINRDFVTSILGKLEIES